MRIALAQINATLGAFEMNRLKILDFIVRAKKRRSEVVIFPEMALTGYPSNDLLERDSVFKRQEQELKKLIASMPSGITAIVGAVTATQSKTDRPYQNSAVVIEKKKKPIIIPKTRLPNYDVFDDVRHFEPGQFDTNFIRIGKKKILVTICEDIWSYENGFHDRRHGRNPLSELKPRRKADGPDAVINLSGSPFTLARRDDRHKLGRAIVRDFGSPFVYVNLVGGQDELIFDGGSFAMNAKGKLVAENMSFEEDLNTIDLSTEEGGFHEAHADPVERLHAALVLGIRDFIEKQGLKRVHLGISGGIDSAVVAALAVDALGPSNVTGLILPGPFSADLSRNLALELARNLGCQSETFEINDAYSVLSSQMEKQWNIQFGLPHENLQARLRGLVLMGFSNSHNSVLLSTSNKSEFATGYSTLYGDMCGGLAPIGDLLKKQVYDLARFYNRHSEVIPKAILNRDPTAELRPNQKDQDTLPEYDLLDTIVENLVVGRKPAKTATEKWVLERMFSSEFKRWQAPPILRVSSHAFGRGRRVPIVNQAKV